MSSSDFTSRWKEYVRDDLVGVPQAGDWVKGYAGTNTRQTKVYYEADLQLAFMAGRRSILSYMGDLRKAIKVLTNLATGHEVQ